MAIVHGEKRVRVGLTLVEFQDSGMRIFHS
jgi:hypothetical protein